MKQRTRKILLRVGAGLMLGMSLFNFGAIWTRQEGSQISSRARNIRQKDKESVDQETDRIASIAERHANAVILTERVQLAGQEQMADRESDKKNKTEDKTIFQQMVRYGVVTVWTVSLGIIFSSVLMDFPISFGEEILALIPGKSKTATLSLESQKSFFQGNEDINIDIFLETDVEDVESVVLAVKFSPEVLEFEGVKGIGIFNEIDIERIDEKNGVVNFVLENVDVKRSFEKKEKIASVEFSGKATSTLQEIGVLQEDSKVIASLVLDEKNQTVNLLDKVQNAKFSIISESGKKIRCGSAKGDFLETGMTKDDWDLVLLETKLPKEALVWQEAGDGIYFVCSFDTQEKLHFLVKSEEAVKKVDLLVKNKKIKNSKENSWQEDNLKLYSFSYDLEKKSNLDDSFKEVLLRFDGDLSWPKKGLAELEL